MENVACEPKKESPIDKALSNLENNIRTVGETMVKFESALSSVICQPECPPDKSAEKTSGQTSLETKLLTMADDVVNIDQYLSGVLNRIQL